MLKLKLTITIILELALFIAILFLPAGTWRWWQGWTFIAVFFIATVAAVVRLLDRGEGLLNERLKSPIQQGQPFADKIVTLLIIFGFLGVLVLTPFDVFRLHLLGRPSLFVASLGMAGFLIGWWIIYLALRENRFAAPVVKHQEDRNQTVIDTGVYGVVRHPMYAGALLVMPGMPLWLGSYAATVLAIVPLAAIMMRLLIEEKFLTEKLTGYSGYLKKVRYRLIPGVW